MSLRRRLLMQSQNAPPSGYRWIEYAIDTYHDYVTLPYGFDPTDTVEIKGSNAADQRGEFWLVGPSTWNNNMNRFSMLGCSYDKFTFTFGTQGSPNDLLVPAVAIDGAIHIATYSNRTFRLVDTGSEMDVSDKSWGGTTTNLRLFYGYSYARGNIYYFKQTKANGDRLYILPIQNKTTGEVEMYDTVSKTIMPRTGTLYAPED